jgi:hypothetical protein
VDQLVKERPDLLYTEPTKLKEGPETDETKKPEVKKEEKPQSSYIFAKEVSKQSLQTAIKIASKNFIQKLSLILVKSIAPQIQSEKIFISRDGFASQGSNTLKVTKLGPNKILTGKTSPANDLSNIQLFMNTDKTDKKVTAVGDVKISENKLETHAFVFTESQLRGINPPKACNRVKSCVSGWKKAKVFSNGFGIVSPETLVTRASIKSNQSPFNLNLLRDRLQPQNETIGYSSPAKLYQFSDDRTFATICTTTSLKLKENGEFEC